MQQSVMVPMRDGAQLCTIILLPKAKTETLPILLTRTPYNAASRVSRSLESPWMRDRLPTGDDVVADGRYIRVFQDVRGKYGSDGAYSLFRIAPATRPKAKRVDDTTDAYDTIDWLIKHLPEANGRVGMIGSSYEGYTVVMALLHPHPALKAAVPESPMMDGWMGDDWFHFGAFRQPSIDYIVGQTSKKDEYTHVPRASADEYTDYLRAGSAEDFAKTLGADGLRDWRLMAAHPSYDQFWKERALDRKLSHQPLTVPTLWVQGLWDQEDMWGALHGYRAAQKAGTPDEMNHLTIGPWFHGQENREGASIGPIHWKVDTATQWRQEVLLRFLDEHLKKEAPGARAHRVSVFNTGIAVWENPEDFPASCNASCIFSLTPLYFGSGRTLSFARIADIPNDGYDEYTSDPEAPVPYRPRPILEGDDKGWKTWLVTDQSFVKARKDVLKYQSEPLADPLKLSGEPMVHLFASTSGTDSDWVVKLIDVDPECNAGSCELPLGIEIFRGRYRKSFSKPSALVPEKPLEYVFPLPMINHTIKAGHRIEVQVQSSLFPLYDRNPQHFVRNIFHASRTDYRVARQRVWRQISYASRIDLPIVGKGNRNR